MNILGLKDENNWVDIIKTSQNVLQDLLVSVWGGNSWDSKKTLFVRKLKYWTVTFPTIAESLVDIEDA